MVNNIHVAPDIENPTHHISLSDGKRTIGLIVSDSEGTQSYRSISRAPLTRTAIQTSSGKQKYADLEPPWISIAQEEWKGGRGNEDFTEDSTRFFDSCRAQTSFGEIFNGPLEYYGTGVRKAVTNYPKSVRWRTMKNVGADRYLCQRIIPAEALTVGEIYALVRRRGNPKGLLSIRIYPDVGGKPGGEPIARIAYTTNEITDTVSEFRKTRVPGTALTAGQVYWLVVTATTYQTTDYWEIGTTEEETQATGSADFKTFTARGFSILYRLAEAQKANEDIKFFTYRQLPFAVVQTYGQAPKVYVCGTIGNADSNAANLSKLNDASKTFRPDQWAGAQVGIIKGRGVEEPVSAWRRIVSNTANTLTVDPPWTIPHDYTTTYLIAGTNLWTPLESDDHGLTGYVTDVCVVNDIVYFAQGDEKAVRRMRWNQDGTPNSDWVSEDDVMKARYLTAVRSQEGLVLWRGNNNDKDGNISVSKARVIDWRAKNTELCNWTTEINAEANHVFTAGVDFGRTDDCATGYVMTVGSIAGTNGPYLAATLQESEDNVVYTDVARFQNAETSGGTYYLTGRCTKRYRRFKFSVYGTDPKANNIVIRTENNLRFSEPYAFHDNYGKITGMTEYGAESTKSLWIFREGMVHSTTTQNSVVDDINLKEIATLTEEGNGAAAITHNVYLYFGWVNGIQRYYNTSLDSDGPDLDSGLPFGRQGRISALLAYPSRYFAAVDAGSEGYSSVLMKNTAGWHEIYRAPNRGERIKALVFQPVIGAAADRLWMAVGSDLIGLMMPSKTVKAVNDANAEYTHESVVISSWHYAGMMDIQKMWNSFKILSENLKADETEIEADYQIDGDTKWRRIRGRFTESPSQKLLLDEVYGVSGKRLRYRLRMTTANRRKTPRVKVVVLEAIGRVDVKYSYSFPYRNLENDRNLSNETEDMSAHERQLILDEWVNNVAALNMRCAYELFDNKRVYLEAVSLSNLKETEEGYLGRITANEI